MTEGQYEGWTVVYTAGTDYEADLVRDRLGDAGIPAVVLTKRDHAFNLTVGDLARVNVLVPTEREAEAVGLLETPFTDAEIEEAAMSADPMAEPAYDEEVETMLDSGIETIRLSPPDEEEDRPNV